jgi:hypothetical protein
MKGAKTGLFPDLHGGTTLPRRPYPHSELKPLFFHSFFHSCGKLRGETLREAQGKGL